MGIDAKRLTKALRALLTIFEQPKVFPQDVLEHWEEAKIAIGEKKDPERPGFKATEAHNPNHRHIVQFMVCRKCLETLPPGESMKTWARLNCGWTKDGFQAWCVRHDINVIHIDFEGVTKVGDTSACSNPSHNHRENCDAPCCIDAPSCDPKRN